MPPKLILPTLINPEHQSQPRSFSVSPVSHARSPSTLTRTTSNPTGRESQPEPESDLTAQVYPQSITRSRSNPQRGREDLNDIAREDALSSFQSLRPETGIRPELRDHDEDASVDEDIDEGLNYTGGFQAPDHREVVGIALSFGAVIVLAIAAGLTTVYDWVL